MKQSTFFDNLKTTTKDFYDEIQEAEERLSNMVKESIPAIPNKNISGGNTNVKKQK